MKKGKLVGVLLAAIMIFGGLTVTKPVKADSAYKFDKQYTLKSGDTATAKSPAETFCFGNSSKAKLYQVQNTKFNSYTEGTSDTKKASEVTGKGIPETITLGNVNFDEGEATSAGTKKKVSITPPEASAYPSAGYYFYEFQEVQGDSAGVTYNTNPYYIRVAVAYNSNSKALEISNITMFNENWEKVTGIENEYSAGKLTVQKIVTGNMANSDDVFDVTVKFTPKNETKLRSTIAGSTNDASLGDVKITGDENEKTATFKVKAETKVIFTNLPADVTYTVEETKADGYDAPAYKTNQKENVNNGTISGGSTDEVIITNNKGTTIDTGVFMNNLPYLLVLLFAAACGVGFVVSKKHGVKED
nr:hypothetical protein [uncultured Anaerostipes sp.]